MRKRSSSSFSSSSQIDDVAESSRTNRQKELQLSHLITDSSANGRPAGTCKRFILKLGESVFDKQTRFRFQIAFTFSNQHFRSAPSFLFIRLKFDQALNCSVRNIVCRSHLHLFNPFEARLNERFLVQTHFFHI